MTNSDGGSFDAAIGHNVLANSHGFVGEYRSFVLLDFRRAHRQREAGNMQRDYWYSAARTLAKLESPEEVGRIAAERTLRRLGARKIKTAESSHRLRPADRAARCSHTSSTRSTATPSIATRRFWRASWAKRFRRQPDGDRRRHHAGGFGTRPFDGEGVPTRRTTVIENGVLKSYLLNTYTAKKLAWRPPATPRAGWPERPASATETSLCSRDKDRRRRSSRDVKQGLLVTEFLGFGVNLVTGDFSRGASGIWIENGELAYPGGGDHRGRQPGRDVRNLAEIGSDLEFRGSMACPTLRIDGMTVAGE